MEDTRPAITVKAIGVRISAPSPSPKAIGNSPKTVVAVVMAIGRRPHGTSLDDGLGLLHAGAAQGVDIVDEHDGVVDDDTGQHNQADKDHYAQRYLRQIERYYHADQC